MWSRACGRSASNWKDPGTEGEIDFIFDQIEDIVGQAQLDLGFRMRRKKVKHRAGQEITAQADRNRNANCTRRLRSGFRGVQICFLNRPQRPAALLAEQIRPAPVMSRLRVVR